MKPQTVLVVDDNEVTRKMVRVALAADGFAVMEAADGREAVEVASRQVPDLILQDIVLPDISGFNLVHQLRALPGVGDIPIVACTGFITKFDELRAASGDFTDFVAKPLEPSHLIEIVRTYLPRTGAGFERTGRGRHVLVADDDPVQRKLTVIRLRQHGYRVTDASDGAEALQRARAAAPDAVVSDVLMPRMDGFQLCLSIRQDPRLAAVPVVLATSSYLEPEDHALAERVGASAFVVRSPDLENVLEALHASLTRQAPAQKAQVTGVTDEAYAHRIIRQLEHQSAMNNSLAQRVTLQAAALAVLSGISDALSRHADADGALAEVLYQCLDAGGLSHGILYLRDANSRTTLHTAAGYGNTAQPRLATFFGHMEVLDRIIDAGETVILPSAFPSREVNDAILGCAEAQSAIIVPLIARDRQLGVLVLAAADAHLADGAWHAFAQTVGAQIAQAVALTRTMTELAASEARHRGLMANANDAIFVLDSRQRVVEANHRAEEILARPRHEIVGQDFTSLCTFDGTGGATRLRQLLSAQASRSDEISMQCPDGPVVPVELSVSTMQLDGTSATLVIARDIRDRKAAAEALRRSEEQLRQSQKMEAIGRLAGGIAHDFNNMLTAMSGYNDLLRDGLDATDPKREDVAEIAKAVERASALTRQLLAFSRQQMMQPRVLSLNATVAELEKMLRRLLPEHIGVTMRLDPALGSVRADPGQIDQVLMNLVVNARDAMADGGVITIETDNAELTDADQERHPSMEVRPGRYVRLTVSDTGIGMDAGTQSQIFEPFFTTKPKGQGTGLGLSTVYGIVKQSGGFIWCYSEPARGTTFKIYLPMVDMTADRPVSEGRRSGGHRGSETILLVEDDPAVRLVTKRSLAKFGYQVLEASNGAEALRLCATHPIRLVVTDMVMPEMSGKELAQRLRAEHPHIRMLFMSGYTEDATRQMDFLKPHDAFIEKPFVPATLAEKMREILDVRAG